MKYFRLYSLDIKEGEKVALAKYFGFITEEFILWAMPLDLAFPVDGVILPPDGDVGREEPAGCFLIVGPHPACYSAAHAYAIMARVRQYNEDSRIELEELEED